MASLPTILGIIAQYLGDGLLVYFGYPVAHEKDAQRAIHTGLGIVEAIRILNTRLSTTPSQLPPATHAAALTAPAAEEATRKNRV
jgi:hypothetical protein